MSHKSYLMTKIWKKTACRYPGNTPIDLKECIVNFFNILFVTELHAARECPLHCWTGIFCPTQT